ncbi:hypothetical protein ECP030230812_5177 [Escherichia coli P0302308.12]|uniref:hypothetical protein n=1 Tax=Escherichia coli TaxID=562 RepID=UPI0002C922C4|nr:hypothetical protein [Escherichia coli]ENH12389.1 hypothetical protein ECP030230812_5177 [Escherichia coli P0302308.12]
MAKVSLPPAHRGGDGIGQVNMLLCPLLPGRITRVCCRPKRDTVTETAVTVQTLLAT